MKKHGRKRMEGIPQAKPNTSNSYETLGHLPKNATDVQGSSWEGVTGELHGDQEDKKGPIDSLKDLTWEE